MASIFFSSYSFLFSFIPSFLLKYTKRKFSNSLDSRRSRQVVACIRAFVFLLFFPFCCFSRLRSFVRRDACGYPGTLRLFSVGHSRDAIFALRLLLLCCFLFPFFSLSLFLFPLLLFSWFPHYYYPVSFPFPFPFPSSSSSSSSSSPFFCFCCLFAFLLMRSLLRLWYFGGDRNALWVFSPGSARRENHGHP